MASFNDLPKELREIIADYYRGQANRELRILATQYSNQDHLADAWGAGVFQPGPLGTVHRQRFAEHTAKARKAAHKFVKHPTVRNKAGKTRSLDAARVGIDARALVIKKAQRKK